MREFPDRSDLLLLIPYPHSINIDNLGDGGTITINTYNAKVMHVVLLVDSAINLFYYQPTNLLCALYVLMVMVPPSPRLSMLML